MFTTSFSERNRERSILNAYASHTSIEEEEFEHNLRCAIEGIAPDQILVRFTDIDPADTSREFSVVIDLSDSSYKGKPHGKVSTETLRHRASHLVPTASPLPPTLPFLLEELNETRDIYSFIKQIRQAFEQLVTQGR